ncbi:T9SS type B sorting domain-containing protein [Flagellimonas baculiformis]|uniref:T9SS type B sorting domain-containing protein n=1 Tax=Flagellimonas baculiformis TaxID=3067310 RepID=UPI00296FECA0|nr:gliding motility-associated C-terminal domain-containing protein [Muricauda sp. D6]
MEIITFERALLNRVVRGILFITICLIAESTSAHGKLPIGVPADHRTDVHQNDSEHIKAIVSPNGENSFDGFLNVFDYRAINTMVYSTDCDGDGVSCEQEAKDGTDPNDPCDFILEHQDCSPSDKWKKDDCDGDGVTNGKEKEDGTDPLDPCDFILAHQNCSASDQWKKDDCDGDGVTNGKEKEDGTDPLDPCDFILAHQNCSPSDQWKKDDCDGDGVSNGQEKEDGTDPLDPCDFVLEHQDCSPSDEWKKDDCDGDGVSNGQEKEDGTDPLDPCDFVLEHQDCEPSYKWKKEDCDGDGVTNGDEKEDGTDPLDPCDYKPESVTLPQSGDYLTADCDGDGVTNEDEKEDGTDPQDPCSFVLGSQTVEPSSTWNTSDCDGDGVTNEDEKEDGTDPLDPCDYNPDSITLTPSVDWNALDCDDDGNPNGTDPDPLVATARDDSGSTPSLTEVALNILENDDYLPNNDGNNLGVTSLSRIGGNAIGTVSFDAETGFMTYTPVASESNTTVTIIYEVCNVLPDPNVCASATVYIQVGANTIDAVDDSYTADGESGGVIPGSNVLSNDTLNGESIDLSDVILTSTPTDVLTINEDGSVSVQPGTADGTYTINYTICEAANVDNCDTATVTVEVSSGMSNVIDAVDDSYTADGETGGVIPGSNVLSNDTLNGESIDLSDVILTSTPTDVLTINEDGSVSVEPGTADGTYTINYTICEVANVDNCDTATVTVEVSSGMVNVIDAVDDSYTADGETGGVIPGSNVLSNDTLNGESIDLSDVILTSTPTDVLTINEDGSVSVEPGTAEGTYTISYTICEAANPGNCDTAIVTVEVENDGTDDEKIEVNQMLTPNGDLKNDFLFIRGVNFIKSSSIKIFNRWGTLVYEGKDYDNVRNVFDGRSRGRSSIGVNSYLPAGVYFYIFNYETAEGSFTDSEYIYISR